MTDVERADLPIETLTVPADIVSGSGNFVLRVRGNGLMHETIRDGDYLIVSPTATPEQDSLVVAETPAFEGQRVRRFHVSEPGTVVLTTCNAGELYMRDSVRVVGVIVGVIRKY